MPRWRQVGVWAGGLLLALLLPATAGTAAQSPAPVPARAGGELTAEEIQRRVLERAERNRDRTLTYEYRSHAVEEKLDSDGRVEEREESVARVFPIDGVRYSRLLEKNGRPLTAKEQREEDKKEQEFRKKLAKIRRGEKDQDDRVVINAELIAKYRYRLLGRENVAGRPAYKIAFEPRSDDLPVNRRMDRILNKVRGTMWIDTEEFEFARVHVALEEEVALWGGLLGRFRNFDLHVEQARITDELWLPANFRMQLDGRVLFRTLRTRVTSQARDYRPFTGPAQQAGAP